MGGREPGARMSGLAVGVAAALAVFLAPVAHGQTSVTLVSNAAQITGGSHEVWSNAARAQPFDTGNERAGYILDSIALDFHVKPTGTGTLTVTVRADSAGEPSATVLHSLTNPTSFVSGLNLFTAPANAALDRNSTYWVVAEYSDTHTTGGPRWYMSLLYYGVDEGAAAGWDIDAPHKRRFGTIWTVATNNTAFQIQVNGRAAPDRSNTAPEFGSTTATRSIDENTPAGVDVGAPVTATGTAGDTLAYSLEGADKDNFEIEPSTGQIETRAPLDHETKPSHSVTVVADDGRGGIARIAVTVSVNDVAERPGTPAAPSLRAPLGTTRSLEASWAAPGRNGGPALTGYGVQYREGGSGAWIGLEHGGTATQAAIPSLDPGTRYQVRVRALNGETPSEWSEPGTGATGTSNATRSIDENTPAGVDVGAPVTATDTAGDTLAYSLEGADKDNFEIEPSTGQIETRAPLDHETKPSHSVTVVADDGRGGTARISVTVSVNDVAERPDTPAAPSLRAPLGTTRSLEASWAAPGRNGGPALTGYGVQYREGGSGEWIGLEHGGTATRAAIPSLDPGTRYQVRVRALNGETPSEWSEPGTGATGTSNATRSIDENTPAGVDVGAPVTATGTDTLTYSLEGADKDNFEIEPSTGQIETRAPLDHETKPSHSVTVVADDGRGGSASIAVTVSVNDVAERPDTPAAPSVRAPLGTTRSLEASWAAPGRNGGPALTGYGVQYREGGGGAWIGLAHGGTATQAAIPSLDPGTRYQVRVRALNGETPSEWSEPGTGATGTSTATRSIDENTPAGVDVGAPVTATGTAGDTLAYSLEGADRDNFEIEPSTGQIETRAPLDHETKPSHSVTVVADDGRGGTARISVTVNVNDVAERPDTPAAPSVRAPLGTTRSLEASWAAPGRNGGPALTGYGVQYREGGGGAWIGLAHGGTATRATIPSLNPGTRYQVRVRALNGETPSEWSEPGTGATGTSNATRSIDENTPAGVDVGAPVTATGTAGDTLAYSLEGADKDNFEIEPSTGQIETRAPLDHETKPSHSVTVVADDGRGGSARISVTVSVNDVAERPDTPAAPSVRAPLGTTRSLEASWAAPGRNGGPALTGYGVQYREGGSGAWIGLAHGGTATQATIPSLDPGTRYQVRVCALNGETSSEWSEPGTGATDGPTSRAPVLPDPIARRSIDENTPAGVDVGAPVTATGTAGDTLAYSLEGADKDNFEIEPSTGQIETRAPLDHETKPSHSVTVVADDGRGGSASISVTVSVNDVAERPGTPAAPSVRAPPGNTRSLEASWAAPGHNGGPALTGYGVQYREGGGGAWIGLAHGGTATRATIPSLDPGTRYQVRVRALNGETPSEWSEPGTGATGTSNATPRTWLTRYARTVAEQVIEAADGRLQATPNPGVAFSLAGERIGGTPGGTDELRSRFDPVSALQRGDDDGNGAGDAQSRAVTGRDLLAGSSLALTGGTPEDSHVSVWGRGAITNFGGREGGLSLDGEVRSAMIGADASRRAWTVGLMVANSSGTGSYQGQEKGKVTSTLTGIYPYGRHALSERVTLGVVVGYAWGLLTLTPDGGKPLKASQDLTMAAGGLRGVALQAPQDGGVELAVEADAMAVRAASAQSAGLGEAQADATLLWLGLEGTWSGVEFAGGALTPRLELGLRHDGGDAETGFGADVGAGLTWAMPSSGLRAELSGHGQLVHASPGMRYRGVAGSLTWAPQQGQGRGPSLTLRQTAGGPEANGLTGLLPRGTMAGPAGDNGPLPRHHRFELRWSYGLAAWGDRLASTPEIGFGLSSGHREYTLGWRLYRPGNDRESLEMSVRAVRREAAHRDMRAEHGIGVRFTAPLGRVP